MTLSTLQTWYFSIIFGIFGACVGSFLCCMSWRIIHNEKITVGRSHCDVCGHTLSVSDLIPVYGYIRHKGRCAYCGTELPIAYLFSELISAAVFVSCFLKYEFSVVFIEAIFFSSVLLAVSFADAEGFIIPDRYILAGIIGKIVFNIFSNGLFSTNTENINGNSVFNLLADDILGNYITSLIGGLTVALPLLILSLIMEKIKHKEVMGGGDIKLFFITGLYLGIERNILCLILACLFGIVIALATSKRTDELFPWGPAISGAAFICVLFGSEILGAYSTLIQITASAFV